MRHSLVCLGAMVLSCAMAAAWTIRVESLASDDLVIRFAYLGPTTDARHQSALKFKDCVEARSSGALRVKLYSGGQLGGDRDAIESVKLGAIEMTVAGAGIFANFEPAMGITALPFLFDTFEQAWAFTDSEINARVSSRLQQQGIRVLGHWDNGFRCITNSVRPIHTPGDLAGLKIRAPENPIILATLETLGASAAPLPWTELYMALQQGVFDGQENPIPVIYIHKLYETQRHLVITNHVYEPMPLVIGEKFWKRLTPRNQAVILEAVRESELFNRHLVRQMTEDFVVQLEQNGMVVTRPDLTEFRKLTAGVRDQFRNVMGTELIDQAYAHSRSGLGTTRTTTEAR